jgi:hypothetical protein
VTRSRSSWARFSCVSIRNSRIISFTTTPGPPVRCRAEGICAEDQSHVPARGPKLHAHGKIRFQLRLQHWTPEAIVLRLGQTW